jgi:hypothetical protein
LGAVEGVIGGEGHHICIGSGGEGAAGGYGPCILMALARIYFIVLCGRDFLCLGKFFSAWENFIF